MFDACLTANEGATIGVILLFIFVGAFFAGRMSNGDQDKIEKLERMLRRGVTYTED